MTTRAQSAMAWANLASGGPLTAIAVAIRPPEDSSIIWTAAGKNAMQDYMFLWAGQSSPLISHDDADALIDSLIAAGDG